MTLAQIEKEIIAGIGAESVAVYRRAELLTEAKPLFETAMKWSDWAKEKFRFGRRYCFRMVKVWEFIKEVEAAEKALTEKSAACGTFCMIRELPFTTVDEISDIPINDLPEFLSKIDIHTITRDELRVEVAVFLGKEGFDLRKYFPRMPPAEQLESVVDRPEALSLVDHNCEYVYSYVFRLRSIKKAQAVGDVGFLKRSLKASEHEVKVQRDWLIVNEPSLTK